MHWLLLAIFGVLGVWGRFWMDGFFPVSSTGIPWGIFTINAVGSFLAAFVAVLATQKSLSPVITLSLITGFCGGFTTFSAFSLQVLFLLEKGQWILGLTYLFFSPLIGLLSALGGMLLARSF